MTSRWCPTCDRPLPPQHPGFSRDDRPAHSGNPDAWCEACVGSYGCREAASENDVALRTLVESLADEMKRDAAAPDLRRNRGWFRYWETALRNALAATQ